jgi:hypothetical protein
MSSLGMIIVMLRILFGSASVVVAAGVGLVTNVFTDGWAWPWGVALVVLVAVGAGLQMAATGWQERPPVQASGAGSVAVGGSVRGRVATRVRGLGTVGGAIPPVAGEPGISVAGPGGVAIGGDVHGGVDTWVDGGPSQ